MPESDSPDSETSPATEGVATEPAADIDQELDRLDVAVDALLEGFGVATNRAREAEDNHRKLAEALRDTDVETMAPTELQARLEELAEENVRLRAAVDEVRTRAERIRSRLMLMEDELEQRPEGK